MSDSMRILRISVGPEPDTYIATLAEPAGREKDYQFSISPGVGALVGSIAFGDEVDAFGRSDLIYKAVWAFHEARQHEVGRPEWALPSRLRGEDAGSSEAGEPSRARREPNDE